MNGTIQRALSKVTGGHPEKWDDFLEPVMFGLRTKKQMTTKYSPYYIMFGREARYPSEIPQEVEIDSSIEDAVASEDLAQGIEEQILLFEKVRKNLDEGHEKTRSKNKSDSKVVFKVGEKVWRQNVRSQQRKGGKLERCYFGPYVITAIKGKCADLQDEKGNVFNKISTDQLKLAVESTPRVPHNHPQPRNTIPAAPPQPSKPCSDPAVEAVTPTPATPPQPSKPCSDPAAEAVTPTPATPPQPSKPCSDPAVEAVTPTPATPPQPSKPCSDPAAEAVTPTPATPPQPSKPCSDPAVEAVTPTPATPPQPSKPCSDPAAEAVTPTPATPPQPSKPCSDPAAEAVTPTPATPPQPSKPCSDPAVEAVTPTPATPPQPSKPCSDPAAEAVTPTPATPPQPSKPCSDPAVEAVTPTPATPPQPSKPCSDPAAEAVTPTPATPPQPSKPCSDPAVEAVTPTPATPPQPSKPCSEETYTTAVVEKYVQEAWEGNVSHVLLSKIGPYKIYYWDIKQIGPNMELESESINAYMRLLVRDHNCSNKGKAALIDSFAMTAIWKGQFGRLKIKPMDHEVLLGVINDHHHWKLAVIYSHEKRSLLLDPLGESKQDIKQCLETTRAFMRNKGCKVSRWKCDTVQHPKQTDSTSCGVFVLKFAEKLLRREEMVFQTNSTAITQHRREIAVKLLLQTDNLSNICRYCGEEEHENDFNWIQCDVCLRWFHQICMNNPSPEKAFVCPACFC
ncbi:proteoglycan 4-like [Cyprinodon tularosa]|uniref:proteoglycan 4-like n=1 Tax=Cyprinodon tularosa TaxID=77115 RepID=UPI0018E220E2|nr:proteoglycan 4-like [Cyprinodon tularosa]